MKIKKTFFLWYQIWFIYRFFISLNDRKLEKICLSQPSLNFDLVLQTFNVQTFPYYTKGYFCFTYPLRSLECQVFIQRKVDLFFLLALKLWTYLASNKKKYNFYIFDILQKSLKLKKKRIFSSHFSLNGRHFYIITSSCVHSIYTGALYFMRIGGCRK